MQFKNACPSTLPCHPRRVIGSRDGCTDGGRSPSFTSVGEYDRRVSNAGRARRSDWRWRAPSGGALTRYTAARTGAGIMPLPIPLTLPTADALHPDASASATKIRNTAGTIETSYALARSQDVSLGVSAIRHAASAMYRR